MFVSSMGGGHKSGVNLKALMDSVGRKTTSHPDLLPLLWKDYILKGAQDPEHAFNSVEPHLFIPWLS